jgi:hypothetical protein
MQKMILRWARLRSRHRIPAAAVRRRVLPVLDLPSESGSCFAGQVPALRREAIAHSRRAAVLREGSCPTSARGLSHFQVSQVGHEGRGAGAAGIGLLRVGSLASPESEPAGGGKSLN